MSRFRGAVWLTAVLVTAGACTGEAPRAERGSAAPTTATTATSVPPITVATLPASPPGPVSGFVAFGDFGGGPAQGAVAAAMERWVADGHRVDALVTTGDNVYDFGEPRLFRPYLDEPYRNLRQGGRPLWVTLGNHDVAHGHGAKQLAHLGLPSLPYAKELPGVRLLFLDANYPDADQAKWLGERLTTPGPPFSVVVFHQPLYSCGLHGPTPAVVANWKPVIESHPATLVLTGHDHDYFRFQTLTGVTYVVTGGGGRDLYPATPDCAPELRASAVRHHFTAVEVYPYRLVVSAVATDGTIFDQVEIPAAFTP
jgi:3',5'-cyclic AMP phosphodiesterase CpdA